MRETLKAIEKEFNRVLTGAGALGAGIMLLLAACVFFLVVARVVFRINAAGLFDLAIFSLIVFPFLTAAYTLREGRHISVDFLTCRLPERTKAILNIGTYLVSLVFVVILGWQSGQWAVNLFNYRVTTTGVFLIPKVILVSIMVFGCFLLTLHVIRMLIDNIRLAYSHELPNQPFSSRRISNPWLQVTLFVTGIIAGIALFVAGNEVAGTILLALVLLFWGVPVFFALGLLGCVGVYFLLGSRGFVQIPIVAYQSMSSFALTCLPLFVMGGLVMEGTGVVEDMFRCFELWLGRSAISPLLVTIAVGLVFCATSGSSVATSAVVAAITLPILISRGFDKGLSAGLVGGATVGSLIPPSIGFVVFAVLTEESIAQLFMAAILPGAVLFSLYFLYVIILGTVSKKSLFENGQMPSRVSMVQVSWKERLSSLKGAVWGLLPPIIILGGIYVGVYTPTEAAAVLVVYAVILCVVKRVSWRVLIGATLRSVLISSMILCIIVSAFVFALLISQLRVAASLVSYAESTAMPANAVLGILFALLTILGLFLEGASIMVITLPIFYPLTQAVGINPLWLGVFYIIMIEIALLTPPVGLNLFVIQGTTGLPLSRVAKGTTPFLFMMVLTLVIMHFFPALVTWLPGTMIR